MKTGVILMDVDLGNAELARGLGIDGCRRAESLNDSPRFLDALADLVEAAAP